MSTMTADSCVRFRLGRQGFGLPLEQVREIVAAGAITPVPLAPAVIRGLANVRGRLVTLIDVATVFQRALPPARDPVERLALILAPPFGHLGVYVHAPVEIGQAVAEKPTQAMSAVAGKMGVGEAGGNAAATTGAGTEKEGSGGSGGPAVGLATVSGELVHMVSARDLVAFCEAKVLEGFRRKN